MSVLHAVIKRPIKGFVLLNVWQCMYIYLIKYFLGWDPYLKFIDIYHRFTHYEFDLMFQRGIYLTKMGHCTISPNCYSILHLFVIGP